MRTTVMAATVVAAAALGVGANQVRADGRVGDREQVPGTEAWAGTWVVVGATAPATRELNPGRDGGLRLEWLQDGEPVFAEGRASTPERLVLRGSTAAACGCTGGLVAAVASRGVTRPGVEVELVRLGPDQGAASDGPWAHDGDGVERLAVVVRRDGREVARERWVRPGRAALELAALRVGVRERPLAADGWRPRRDGPLTLVVRVLGAPQRVALVVRDARGAPLRVLGGEALLAPGLHRLGWDGRVGPEPGARVVPAGDYRLALDSPELYMAHGEDAAPVTTTVRVAARR